MKRLYFFCFLIFISAKIFGQTATCPQTLRLARATYEQGRLHEIESQLKDCLATGFTKDQKALKTEGYKILCLSYIYLEEAEKADEAMLNILRTDPYFQINEAVDPAEFVALYKTFRTLPIYRIGGKLGVSATLPNVTEKATASELESKSEYSPLIGIQFGISADKPINTRLTIHAELLYSQKQFKFTHFFGRQQDYITGEEYENVTNGIENQTWLSIPLSVEYKPLKNKSKFNEKFNPYVTGGIATDYLLAAKIKAEQLRDNQPAIQEKTYDVHDLRNSLNISGLVGIGAKIRVGGGYIRSEIRYLYGFINLSSQETAYEDQALTWEVTYADPVFKISSLEISAAYIQNVFNPKKLKRRR